MSALKPLFCVPACVARRSVLRVAALVCGALAQPCPGATSIQNFSALSNDRFANNAAFIGSGFDWSGVGRSSDGHWGTLLTPNIFLSANHYHPGVGSALVFFPGNDPGAASVARTVVSGQAIGGSDLWVGYLDAEVPTTITDYEFSQITVTQAGFETSALANLPVFISGLTPTSSGYGAVTATVQTVGTNRLEGFYDDLFVDGSTGDVLATVQNLAGDETFGFSLTSFEAQVQSGDSGSPLMTVVGGHLVLAGITWANGTVDIDPNPLTVVDRPASAFTYTGSFATEILALIPEPGVAFLVLVSSAAWALRRRRAG